MGIKATTAKSNFNAGEISPRALGRFDQAKYANGVKKLENFLNHQVGGVYFRPGTVYTAATKYSNKKSRLIVFQYSTEQGYQVEIGDLYMRFFTLKGRLLSGGVHVEIASPYTEDEIDDIQFSQNANVQYLVHPNHPPYKLSRTSATTFKLEEVNLIRGPFLDANITHNTLSVSATTGNITVTANASVWAVGVAYVKGPDIADFVTNGGNTYKCLTNHVAGATFAADLALGYWSLVGAGDVPNVFTLSHVGSLWRYKGGVFKITGFANTHSVTASVQAEPDGTAGSLTTTGPVTDWAEAAFSGYRGYPAAVTFHGQRLYYANTNYQRQTFWGSYIGQFDNFKTTSDLKDDEAVTYKLGSEQVNEIRWLVSSVQTLQNGTSGGTFSANAGGTTGAITPTSIEVNNDTNYGVAKISPKKLASYLYYVQKNRFALRELTYNYIVNRQITKDLTDLADHILRDGGGAISMDYQQSPNDRLWLVRQDGQIAVVTRNPDEQVTGWCRIKLADSSEGPAVVESLSILQTDAEDDQVWVIVKRIINGSIVRWVEYFSSEFFDNYWEPVRVDASLTYDVPLVCTGMTNADPGVFDVAAHGLSNGDQIRADSFILDVDPEEVSGEAHPLNGKIFYVKNATTNTFQIADQDDVAVDTTTFGEYVSGGAFRKTIQTVSGLDHLNGETVSVQVDGAVPSGEQEYIVSGGTITLSQKAATVHVGLKYDGTMQLLKMNEGAVVGQTKIRRVYISAIRVLKSLGFKIGKSFSNLDRVILQNVNDPLTQGPALFSGDIEKFIETSWRPDDEIIIHIDHPLPLFILAIFIRSEVEESV